MLVNVVLFAAAKEVAAADHLIVAVSDGATVAELKTAVIAQVPELATLVTKSVFSVDHQYAADDDFVNADSEIALIPPVSGG